MRELQPRARVVRTRIDGGSQRDQRGLRIGDAFGEQRRPARDQLHAAGPRQLHRDGAPLEQRRGVCVAPEAQQSPLQQIGVLVIGPERERALQEAASASSAVAFRSRSPAMNIAARASSASATGASAAARSASRDVAAHQRLIVAIALGPAPRTQLDGLDEADRLLLPADDGACARSRPVPAPASNASSASR